MVKKVLVMCQRKKGTIYTHDGHKPVEEIIVPRINNIIQKILGTDEEYHIEYLSHNVDETQVDVVGEFGRDIKFTTDFLTKNENSYSLIILNTCPFMLMKYEYIHKLLHDNGYMAFTIYPNDVGSKPLIGQVYQPNLDGLDNFFVKKEDYYMDMNISKNEIWLYQKKNIKKGGNGRRRKKKTYKKNIQKKRTKKRTKKSHKGK